MCLLGERLTLPEDGKVRFATHRRGHRASQIDEVAALLGVCVAQLSISRWPTNARVQPARSLTGLCGRSQPQALGERREALPRTKTGARIISHKSKSAASWGTAPTEGGGGRGDSW